MHDGGGEGERGWAVVHAPVLDRSNNSHGDNHNDSVVTSTYFTSRVSRTVQIDTSLQPSAGGSYDEEMGVRAFCTTTHKPVNRGESRSVRLDNNSTTSGTTATSAQPGVTTCTFTHRSNPGKVNKSAGTMSGASISKQAHKVSSVVSRKVSLSRNVTLES